ncbi:flagellar protein FlaG [Undibacterium sp. SXout7W]|uniref:flagellar protein FlaG n=1 Tax=Undibacterium sp. SXout7W TaxID=3413049 RepID=UPI003BF16E10
MVMDIPSIGSTPQSGQLISDKSATISTNVGQSNIAPTVSTAVANTTSSDKTNNKKIDASQIEKAVADINKAMQSHSQDLRFSVDTDSKRVVVKIIDQQTNQVLRQIPTEEALEISKSLDKLKGVLIKQEV